MAVSEEKLKKWFTELDKDKDGFLSVNDSIVLLRAGGKVPTATQMEEIAKEVTNPKGLKFEGFKALHSRPSLREPARMKEKMLRMFRILDVADERAMKEQQLKDVLYQANLEYEDVDAFLKHVTKDEDGFIEYHGLLELLCK